MQQGQHIRALVDKIMLRPEAGALRVDLKGELAGILAIAQSKAAAPGVWSGRLVEQVKMVAGARNRLYLLLFAPALPLAR